MYRSITYKIQNKLIEVELLSDVNRTASTCLIKQEFSQSEKALQITFQPQEFERSIFCSQISYSSAFVERFCTNFSSGGL